MIKNRLSNLKVIVIIVMVLFIVRIVKVAKFIDGKTLGCEGIDSLYFFKGYN